MRVLVTGGAGFIGSNIVELMLQKGHVVYSLDDFSHASFKNLGGLDCDLICGDILDADIFKRLPRLDAIVHEAAITDTTLKNDRRMVMVNFEGFKNILRYCLKKKIKLVYASSAGVYGDGPSPMREAQSPRPLNIYAYSKLLCDREVYKLMRKKDISPIVGLRYFNVYGHREYHKGESASMVYQLYLQMDKNKMPRIFKFGEQKRDFIYIKDVSQATVKALDCKKCTIINVGTGRARSFNDIVDIINKVLKKDLRAEYFNNPFTGVYQDYTLADITTLKKSLGFSPQYSLEKGIQDYITNYLLEAKNIK